MTVFADASALVKLYADEEGCEDVRRHDVLVVSVLSRVEVPAALWRKVRTGQLPAEDAAELTAAFEVDYLGLPDEPPRFAGVAATPEVLEDAARLVAVHGLRAYDAVQLASALAARSADPSCSTLLAFDRQLLAAAAAERFAGRPRT